MNSIFGIPAHPLFVHIPVVLIPLAAFGVVVMVIRPTWWERYKWATLAVSGAGMLGSIVAASSGEGLEDAVRADSNRELLRDHVGAGETARTVSIVFFAVLFVAVVVLPWWTNRQAQQANASSVGGNAASAGSPRWWRSVVSIVLVGTALGSAWTVYDAGHSGAKSVWSDVKVGEGEGKGDRGGDGDD